ncbi:hypothetical protein HK099_005858, partial [Clydaea vesicula]
MQTQQLKYASKPLENYINGSHVANENWDLQKLNDPKTFIPVCSPSNGEIISYCPLSNKTDVEIAVKSAKAAFESWSNLTVKSRVQILIRFHQLVIKHSEELADIIVLEHGKTKSEALAEIAKGNETVEYSLSMPQLIQGKWLEVSRGVQCNDSKKPVGVVASIVPFNFPFMVPFWTIPIALATGNTMIIKPSEKVPLTMNKVMELFKEAGLPNGVINLVNGTAEAVLAICDHPDIKAVTFVGTSHVAEIVSKRCRNLNKRVLALGGAKNHLVAAPDAIIEMTAQDVVNSFTGCSGQRCMAASVLLTIGSQPVLLDEIVQRASMLTPGSGNGQMGPVIDLASKEKILKYINESEASGAKILLDGRKPFGNSNEGFWIGPTVILHKNKNDRALHDEIFGPVISILEVATKEEAIEFENANPYGNA